MSRFVWVKYVAIILLTTCGCANSQDYSAPRIFLKRNPSDVGISNYKAAEILNAAKDLPNIYSFLVLKNDTIVFEEYMNGANSESLLHIRSITKSISSILVGIAIDRGILSGTDVMLKDYFDDYLLSRKDDHINEITLEHLLDMKSGFEWNESGEAIKWYTSVNDTWGYIFSKEVIEKPGSKFNYNSGSASLLNRFILNRADNISLESFAWINFLNPLNIDSWSWEKDGLGNSRADAGLQLRAIDLIKVGYMFNNEGEIFGNRVVGKEWIASSWNYDNNLNTNYGPIENLHYNNLWWMGMYDGIETFFGLGYGGQLLICVPDLDLVVVANHEFRLDPSVASTHSTKFLNNIFRPLMEVLVANK